MEIKIFTASPIESTFELGGLEFYGKKNNFTRDKYTSQDLQMVFIVLPVFSFSIRSRNSKFKLSSNIELVYKEKTNSLFINNILIEHITYTELMQCIYNAIKAAINILRDNFITDTDPILSDLNDELTSIKKI